MSVGAVSGPGAWSARDHWAAINTHLEALALMPTVDAAAGDHLDLTLQALTTRRRMDAVAARTLDAMACSGEWSSRGGARTAAAWLSGATTEAPGVVRNSWRMGRSLAAMGMWRLLRWPGTFPRPT